MLKGALKWKSQKIDEGQHTGRTFSVRYMTNGYYDIRRTDMAFQAAYENFEKPTEMPDLFDKARKEFNYDGMRVLQSKISHLRHSRPAH